MSNITSITAREILDATATPTIEATVTLDDGTVGIASCPNSLSVGTYEAVTLQDGDPKHYEGNGVRKAIETIHTIIAPQLTGMEAARQQEIDRKMIELDGTPNKAQLGANTILSVSMAVTKAAATAAGVPLYRYLKTLIQDQTPPRVPTPIFNVINGGKQAGNTLDIQEFLAIPATFKSFSESLEIGVTIYRNLMSALSKNYLSTLISNEGGFAPALATNQDALSLISQAIDMARLRLGYDIFTGIDCAANTFFSEGRYKLRERQTAFSAAELSAYYDDLVKRFNILYLEDGCAEDDLAGWRLLNEKVAHSCLIVGDTVTATNPGRLQLALDKKAITGVVIKPDQIGTVMESLAVIGMAKEAGLKVIVSHRSSETNDDFMADLGVAVSADYIKCGAPVRGEFVAKYNRLLAIEKELMAP
jgi:enolase